MRIVVHLVIIMTILALGFATGFQVGQSDGFSLGSEWALMQAELLAREEGLFMPIRYDDGQFRVILRQPHHLYRRAWQIADRYGQDAAGVIEDAEDAGDPAQTALNCIQLGDEALGAPEHSIINAVFQPALVAPSEEGTAEEDGEPKESDLVPLVHRVF
jgi:hypothetical protein